MSDGRGTGEAAFRPCAMPPGERGPEVPVDCEETIHRLYFFLDGELTEDRRRAISAHLDFCGDCLDAVDFEAELRRVVADRCKDRVPDSLRQRIAEALRHEQTPTAEPSPARPALDPP